MDADELRAMQAPFRERYRADPAAAATPTFATATFADPGVTTTVEGWAGDIRAGLHPALGGSGADACSADLLMQALLACTGVTLRAVAIARRIEIRSAGLRADGVFDARGTLGVDRTVPVGVTDVVVTVTLDTDASDAELERLVVGVERYCVVARSLAEPPRFLIVRA